MESVQVKLEIQGDVPHSSPNGQWILLGVPTLMKESTPTSVLPPVYGEEGVRKRIHEEYQLEGGILADQERKSSRKG